MSGYIGATPVPQATQHRESFTCTVGQTSFASAGYTPQFLDVFLNGNHLSPSDFVATNGSDVVLVSGAAADDVCDIISYTAFEVADQTFTGTTTMTDVVAASLDISGNIDIDGITNLDVVDIDGAVQLDSTLTVGVDDTGYDVKFFGATASAFMQWDASQDDLILGGVSRLGIGIAAPLAKLNIAGNTDTFDGMAKIYLTDSNSNSASRNWSIGNGGSAYGSLTFAVSAAKDGNAGNGTAANAMVINNAGIVTKPLQPAFEAKPASTQSNIAINSQLTIVFGTEVFDQNADFNNTNAANKFTAPVAGKYQFNFSLFLSTIDSAAAYYVVYIVTTNENIEIIFDPDFGQDAAYWNVTGSVLCELDASDTAALNIQQSGGTSQTDIHVASRFSGYLVA